MSERHGDHTVSTREAALVDFLAARGRYPELGDVLECERWLEIDSDVEGVGVEVAAEAKSRGVARRRSARGL